MAQSELAREIHPGLLIGDILIGQIMIHLGSGVNDRTSLLEASLMNWPPDVGQFTDQQVDRRISYLRILGLVDEDQLRLTEAGTTLLEDTTRFAHSAQERRRSLGLKPLTSIRYQWFLER